MSTPSPIPLLAALLAALSGCSVDHKDLVKVCEGKGIGRAPAYDPGADGDPYLVFPAYQSYTSKRFLWESDLLDDRLTKSHVRSPYRDEYKNTPLTMCVDQIGEEFYKDCEMGRNKTLKLYHAHYRVSFRETRTAREIASETFWSRHTKCPSVAFMARNALEEKSYPYSRDEAPVISRLLAAHLPEKIARRIPAEAPPP
jgi:hypothetical protein